jgi:anti-anti-sigma factor
MTSRSGDRFSVTVTRNDKGRSLAAVVGELDMDGAPQLRQSLTAALQTASRLDLDLSGVSFCDSSGLHVLLEIHRHAEDGGRQSAIVRASPQVRRLMEVTGTEDLLTECVPSAAGAESRFAWLLPEVARALADVGFPLCAPEDEDASGVTVQVERRGVIIGWTDIVGPRARGELMHGHEHDQTASYPGIHKALRTAVIAALRSGGFVVDERSDDGEIVVTDGQTAGVRRTSGGHGADAVAAQEQGSDFGLARVTTADARRAAASTAGQDADPGGR